MPNSDAWPPNLEKNDDFDLLDNTKKPDLWRFLCLDTASKNAFKTVESKEMGAAFADSLYILFKMMQAMENSGSITPKGN